MASTIKVDNVQNQPGNNLINRCSATTTVGSGAGNTINVDGATITIGRCGGTVSLASGATQSGFGASYSAVVWDTSSIKTATFTAAASYIVLLLQQVLSTIELWAILQKMQDAIT